MIISPRRPKGVDVNGEDQEYLDPDVVAEKHRIDRGDCRNDAVTVRHLHKVILQICLSDKWELRIMLWVKFVGNYEQCVKEFETYYHITLFTANITFANHHLLCALMMLQCMLHWSFQNLTYHNAERYHISITCISFYACLLYLGDIKVSERFMNS